MLKIFYFVTIFCVLSSSPSLASSSRDFDEHTLRHLVESSGHVFREFGLNNFKQHETQNLLETQVIPKHGLDMYTLWSHANNWANAGATRELKTIRDRLNTAIPFNGKSIIKGKLKQTSFLLINLSLKKLKEKILLTIQNGRMKIEKDRGGGYDLIFQYKFSGDVGLTQEKHFESLGEEPVLSKRRGAKVLAVVIGMYDFLDAIWALTEKSGMTTEEKVMDLIHTHPGRLKSVYVLSDYSI